MKWPINQFVQAMFCLLLHNSVMTSINLVIFMYLCIYLLFILPNGWIKDIIRLIISIEIQLVVIS